MKFNYSDYYEDLILRWQRFHPIFTRLQEKHASKYNQQIKMIGGHFLLLASEIWVASILEEAGYNPRIERKKKHADVYVNDIGIEVKGSTEHFEKISDERIPWWGFNLQKDTKTDKCKLFKRDWEIMVLVLANEVSKPISLRAISRQELLNDGIAHREGGYYIEISNSKRNFEKLMRYWEWKPTKVEIRLNRNPLKNDRNELLRQIKRCSS